MTFPTDRKKTSADFKKDQKLCKKLKKTQEDFEMTLEDANISVQQIYLKDVSPFTRRKTFEKEHPDAAQFQTNSNEIFV